ncbi:PREDICTED: proline-rich protein 3-like [Camelina sativa]|uniref:Proline-rich protein 3-like n=1 Tax=Camelina sativa TaxID=90675 RepID=A0ABM0SM38_CAMSA|nr:PREDICTED: proline-rich protein 3-like [Camelina sativa]
MAITRASFSICLILSLVTIATADYYSPSSPPVYKSPEHKPTLPPPVYTPPVYKPTLSPPVYTKPTIPPPVYTPPVYKPTPSPPVYTKPTIPPPVYTPPVYKPTLSPPVYTKPTIPVYTKPTIPPPVYTPPVYKPTLSPPVYTKPTIPPPVYTPPVYKPTLSPPVYTTPTIPPPVYTPPVYKPTPSAPVYKKSPIYSSPPPPYVPKPTYTAPTKPYVPEILKAVDGIILCKNGYKTYPILGAKVKIVCSDPASYGKDKNEVVIYSNPTDSKGYFHVSLTDIKDLAYCRVKLYTSPIESCNNPTNVNKGLTGVPLSLYGYRFYSDKNLKLFSVGPFYYTGPKAAPATPKY